MPHEHFDGHIRDRQACVKRFQEADIVARDTVEEKVLELQDAKRDRSERPLKKSAA